MSSIDEISAQLLAGHQKKGTRIKTPKDLDDVFESVAAAIYVDSCLVQAVWKSYYPMLKGVLGK